MAAASDLGGSAASSAMVLMLLASMVEFEDAAIGVSSNKKVPSVMHLIGQYKYTCF